MKTYRVREDIYLIELCGEHLIVSNRKLWDKCPSIQMMSGLGLILWKMLEKGTDRNKMIKVLQMLTKEDDMLIASKVDKFLDALMRNGYLVEENE